MLKAQENVYTKQSNVHIWVIWTSNLFTQWKKYFVSHLFLWPTRDFGDF